MDVFTKNPTTCNVIYFVSTIWSKARESFTRESRARFRLPYCNIVADFILLANLFDNFTTFLDPTVADESRI